MKKTTVASLLLSLVSSLVLIPAQTAGATGGYVDVPEEAFYADAVEWSVEANITGITSDFFAPAQPSTRGETAVWIWRMAGQQDAPAHTFADLPTWQSPAVAWLLDQGVTTGTSTTTFSPSRTLTRGELAAFLWRSAGEPAAEPHSFNDVVKAWQQNAVSWLATSGITTGTSATTFSPGRTLSRAELVTFLYRYNQRYPSTENAQTATVEEEPVTSTTTVAASQAATITVPPDAPSGRCASQIPSGVYNWETCAWHGYRENPVFNYSLSDAEAAALIEQIWEEVNVANKPEQPPTNSLVPAGSECANITASGFTIGCYEPDRHHIRRLDAFLDTLLHEVAHAFVTDDPSVIDCVNGSTDSDHQACAHNDVFRCVADHLYATYAGIPSAGVCGTTPTTTTGGPTTNPTTSTTSWEVPYWDSGALLTAVDAAYHDREYPYEEDWASLVVRCSTTGQVDVFFAVESGYLSGQREQANRIPVVYQFYPVGWLSWSDAALDAWHDNNPLSVEYWYESDSNTAGFQPDHQIKRFINSLVDNTHEDVHLAVMQWDDTWFGAFWFPTAESYDHIRTVTEECGWTWD